MQSRNQASQWPTSKQADAAHEIQCCLSDQGTQLAHLVTVLTSASNIEGFSEEQTNHRVNLIEVARDIAKSAWEKLDTGEVIANQLAFSLQERAREAP